MFPYLHRSIPKQRQRLLRLQQKAVEKATADVPATVEQQKEAEKKNTYQFPPCFYA